MEQLITIFNITNNNIKYDSYDIIKIINELFMLKDDEEDEEKCRLI